MSVEMLIDVRRKGSAVHGELNGVVGFYESALRCQAGKLITKDLVHLYAESRHEVRLGQLAGLKPTDHESPHLLLFGHNAAQVHRKSALAHRSEVAGQAITITPELLREGRFLQQAGGMQVHRHFSVRAGQPELSG